MLKKQAVKNARSIVKIFVREDAPSEVNIDHGQRKRCLSQFNKAMAAVGGPILKTVGYFFFLVVVARHRCLIGLALKASFHQQDVFDEAQDEIFKVMSKDIFPRFAKSEIARGLCWAKLDPEYEELVSSGLDQPNRNMKKTVQEKKEEEDKRRTSGRRSTIGAGLEAVKGFFANPSTLVVGSPVSGGREN